MRWASRKRASIRLTTLALTLLLAASLGVACAPPLGQQTSSIHTSKVLTPHGAATTGATSTPDVAAQAARNTALGCHIDDSGSVAPAPQPQLLYGGQRPGAPEPAPNEVALTFDDGPTPYTTPPILDFLEQTHTPATFFVEGQYIHRWPNLLRRQWNDGFAIAVHTWNHPMMTRLPDAQVHQQFRSTLDAIHTILGADACVWLWRPPFADYNAHVMSIAASYGLSTITWDSSGSDWERPGADKIAERVLLSVHPGAVILLHDGPALREQTRDALPLILAGLKARGLIPVTLPKLLADGHYPGISVGEAPLPTSASATRTPAAQSLPTP